MWMPNLQYVYNLQSNDEQMTEAQFLKERNLNIKERLLQDTSSESELDELGSDDEVNGAHGDEEPDSDDENDLSESDDSVLEKFLNKNLAEIENNSMMKKVQEVHGPNLAGEKTNGEKDDSPPETNKDGTEVKSVEMRSADQLNDDGNSSSDDFAEPKSLEKSERRRAQIGKNVFGNIDKNLEIIFPEDNDKIEDSPNGSKRRSGRSSKNNSDCEILDTSMFKETKTKTLDGAQLSKRLSNVNRQKVTTSRALPDDTISLSSDSDLEMETIPKTHNENGDNADGEEETSKRATRQMLRPDQLAGETKRAQREENERVKRLVEKHDRIDKMKGSQKQDTRVVDGDNTEEKPREVLLDYHTKEKMKIVVHKEIVKHLKEHQIEGIKFMYDCCYGSVDEMRKFPGSGCILAHCMGLGKTLQVINSILGRNPLELFIQCSAILSSSLSSTR